MKHVCGECGRRSKRTAAIAERGGVVVVRVCKRCWIAFDYGFCYDDVEICSMWEIRTVAELEKLRSPNKEYGD